MPQVNLKNKFGKIIGWNDIQFEMFGRVLEGIKEFEYDDNVEWENVMGAGKYPVGQGEGEYSAKCSVTLLTEEVLALQEALPVGKRLQDLKGTATVHYEYADKIYIDKVNNIRIKTNSRAFKQGDKEGTTKLDIVCTHIDWYTNR